MIALYVLPRSVALHLIDRIATASPAAAQRIARGRSLLRISLFFFRFILYDLCVVRFLWFVVIFLFFFVLDLCFFWFFVFFFFFVLSGISLFLCFLCSFHGWIFFAVFYFDFQV